MSAIRRLCVRNGALLTSPLVSSSALVSHVSQILGSGALEKVFFTNTGAMVAFVASVKHRWHWTVDKLIRDAMSVQGTRLAISLIFGADSSVASLVNTPGPNPARTQVRTNDRAIFIDLSPKPFFEGADFAGLRSVGTCARAKLLPSNPGPIWYERGSAMQTNARGPLLKWGNSSTAMSLRPTLAGNRKRTTSTGAAGPVSSTVRHGAILPHRYKLAKPLGIFSSAADRETTA